MQADELIAEACASAELDDFGSDSYREGLDIYCASVTDEAQSERDRAGWRSAATSWAGSSTGCASSTGSKQHPEVRDGADRRAARRDRDVPRRHDVPELPPRARPEQPRVAELGDRRQRSAADRRATFAPARASTRRGSRATCSSNSIPECARSITRKPNGPTECISLMSQDFKSLLWEAMANVPSYGRWLLQTDQRSAYEYHRQVLQVLQSGGVRGRWTLKTPHHAIALDALTAVYPDAQLVLLHRDPVALCASVCSLITELSGCFTDADHRAYITDHWVALLETSVARIDAFRAAHPDHPIVDVQYDALVRDPVETVAVDLRRVRRLGRRHRRTKRWRRTRPRTRRTRSASHAYTLEQYGLDRGRDPRTVLGLRHSATTSSSTDRARRVRRPRAAVRRSGAAARSARTWRASTARTRTRRRR